MRIFGREPRMGRAKKKNKVYEGMVSRMKSSFFERRNRMLDGFCYKSQLSVKQPKRYETKWNDERMNERTKKKDEENNIRFNHTQS